VLKQVQQLRNVTAKDLGFRDFIEKSWPALVVVLTLSLAQLMFSFYLQDVFNRNGLSRYELSHFHFSPDAWGLAVRDLILPIAIVYLMSNLGFFRRAALDKWRKGDKLILFFAFAIAQCLLFVFSHSLALRYVDQVSYGFLMIIIAGFVGGWSMGLSIGLLSFYLLGASEFIQYPPDTAASLWQKFYWKFLTHEAGTVAIWIGLSSGVLYSLFKKYRYLPVIAFTVAAVLTAASRYIIAIPAEKPHDVIEPLLPITLLTASAVMIVALLIRNVQVNESRKLAEEAHLALAEAELRALRAQINPHFFFNALNTIRYFVRVEPEQARSLLLDVSEVFKQTLQAGEFVPLRAEISYVEAYLNIEKARLQERLEISWALPNDALLDIPVPTLCLQTIVENAVIHGIAPKADGGELNISIEVWDDILHITVRDTGLGFDVESRSAWKKKKQVETAGNDEEVIVQIPSDISNDLVNRKDTSPDLDVAQLEKKTSIGLKNVEERLKRYYGEDYPLRIESEIGVGTRVQMRIPISEDFESNQDNS